MALSPATSTDAEALTGALEEARERTLTLVSLLDDCALEQVHSRLMSPLVWDLGHIAAFEDLWLVHRFGGEDMVRRDLAEVYDAFETPRAGRGDLPFLRPPRRASTWPRCASASRAATDRTGPGDGLIARARHPPRAPAPRDDAADDQPRPGSSASTTRCAASRRRRRAGTPASRWSTSPAAGSRWAPRRPASPTTTSARATAWRCPPSASAARPSPTRTWMSFSEGGGYERREWWSDEAWALEGGVRHHPPPALGRRRARVDRRRVEAARPRQARRPRLLVRGRRLRQGAWRPPSHRAGVGEGGDLGPGDGKRAGRAVGPGPVDARAGQPRPPRLRHRSRGLAPGGRLAQRVLGHARRRLGVDVEPLRRLPGLPRAPVPGVLRGLLRRRLPRAARRLVGHPRRAWPRRPSATGTTRSAARSSPACGSRGTHERLARGPGRIDVHLGEGTERRLADDVLDGLTKPFKEIPPKHFYDSRGSELFERSASCPSTTRRAPRRRSCASAAAEIAGAAGAPPSSSSWAPAPR